MRRVSASLAVPRVAAATRGLAAWNTVQMGPPDPILGLSVAFNADKAPNKVNLGVGVYRGDDGKPFVLECVKEAKKRVVGLDHEYAPITGLPAFVDAAQHLAFGVADPVKRIASSQTLSGTGALRVAGDFLKRYAPVKDIYLPAPTWGNHASVFRDAGLNVKTYTYYDAKKVALNFEGMLGDLDKLPEGTIVLLHACAHNPTGIDPTHAQWDRIVDVVLKRKLLPLVDMAYQGFASGDPDRDAYALRKLTASVGSLVMCQSFAKSFGLYGERTGAVHVLCQSPDEKERVLSQLKILIRPMYSNPPLYGARIVSTIFKDETLVELWRTELRQMADRMNGVRRTLVDELKACGSQREWGHITKQIGMMAFTGLSKEQVAVLKAEHHVYMTDDGRAAISGLNSTNVKAVAAAFHAVTK